MSVCTYWTCLFKGLGSHGQFIKRGQTNVHTQISLFVYATFALFSLRGKDLYAYTHTFNKVTSRLSPYFRHCGSYIPVYIYARLR